MAEGEPRRTRALVGVEEAIGRRIQMLRGERVLLAAGLAELYGVKTKRLNEAVRRNRARFPSDFMFQLNAEEARNLRSQSATSSSGGYGGRRYLPYAFTEQGVAMLSSVLSSPRAIAVNVLIMRTFVQLRRAEGQYAELRQRVEELAEKFRGHDELLSEILSVLDALGPAPSSSRPIGFRPPSGAPQGSGAQTMKPTWPGPRPTASDTTASSENSAALEPRRSRGARTATRPGVLRTAVGRASQSRSVVPPPAREERKMSTLTARIPRRTQLRKETPFAQVLESFFIHNGMAPKTKDFYRGNFNAMASGSDRASN